MEKQQQPLGATSWKVAIQSKTDCVFRVIHWSLFGPTQPLMDIKNPHSKKLLSQDEEINLFFFFPRPNLIRPQKLSSRAGPSKMCLPHWHGSLTFMSGWGLFMHYSSVAFTGDKHYHQVPALCTGDITQSVCLQEMTKEVDVSLSWEIKIKASTENWLLIFAYIFFCTRLASSRCVSVSGGVFMSLAHQQSTCNNCRALFLSPPWHITHIISSGSQSSRWRGEMILMPAVILPGTSLVSGSTRCLLSPCPVSNPENDFRVRA